MKGPAASAAGPFSGRGLQVRSARAAARRAGRRRPRGRRRPAAARGASARTGRARPSAGRTARSGCRGRGPPASPPAGPARSAARPRSGTASSVNGSESRSSSSTSSGARPSSSSLIELAWISLSRTRLASSRGAARTSSSSCLIMLPIRMTLAGCSTMLRHRDLAGVVVTAAAAERHPVLAHDQDLGVLRRPFVPRHLHAAILSHPYTVTSAVPPLTLIHRPRSGSLARRVRNAGLHDECQACRVTPWLRATVLAMWARDVACAGGRLYGHGTAPSPTPSAAARSASLRRCGAAWLPPVAAERRLATPPGPRRAPPTARRPPSARRRWGTARRPTSRRRTGRRSAAGHGPERAPRPPAPPRRHPAAPEAGRARGGSGRGGGRSRWSRGRATHDGTDAGETEAGDGDLTAVSRRRRPRTAVAPHDPRSGPRPHPRCCGSCRSAAGWS